VNSKYDVVVAGLGVHGSAAARALAIRGLRVLGLDARRPPHTEGSSHGRTRIIREAYFEHPLYVPLVQRSLALWRDLETDARRTLLCETGAIDIGPADGVLVEGALASCRGHGIPHALLDAGEIRQRFPGLLPRTDDVGVLEERAGALLAEACIESLLHVARSAGATILVEEELTGWCADDGTVTVATSRGTHEAGALVLALGPWLAGGLANCPLPLAVERQTQHWFDAPPALRAGHCPVVLWEYEPDHAFYVIPDIGHGVKAAVHHEGEVTRSAEAVERSILPRDGARVRALLDRFMPGVGRALDSAVCVYTNTPDHHFIVDRHPAHEHVVLVSACSGHGFKFAPVIGEAAADLATMAVRAPELEPFRLDRFSP
jgi:sarcosine oxidase